MTTFDLAALTAPFDLAALDMAGTTVNEDGIVYEVLEATAADFLGEPIPHDVLFAWKGTSKWEALQGIFGALNKPNDHATVDKAFADFNQRLLKAYQDRPPSPYPGVLDMINELRSKGVKVALQTGYDTEQAGAILHAMGWTAGGPDATVDVLVTSDLVAASRPAPFLIFHAMEATGVTDVRRVLVAGDTPNDLLAGTHAGAGFVIGVRTGGYPEDKLTTYPHTHILDGVADITTLL